MQGRGQRLPSVLALDVLHSGVDLRKHKRRVSECLELARVGKSISSSSERRRLCAIPLSRLDNANHND